MTTPKLPSLHIDDETARRIVDEAARHARKPWKDVTMADLCSYLEFADAKQKEKQR